jgi:cell fate (sporulation/competence/biofilm development) regulator YlbF (YheA/YmcA/DUF963 family)
MEFIDVIRLAERLRESLISDPRYQALITLEQELAADTEVVFLADAMRRCAVDYENATDDDTRRTAAQKRLHQAKLALDRHPSVRRYYEVYKPVRELYDMIQKEVFAPFNLHVCGGER